MMLKPALRPPLRAPMRGATTLREGGGDPLARFDQLNGDWPGGDLAPRRNVWQYTEDVASNRYITQNATKQTDTYTVMVNGAPVILTRVTSANFYSSLRSQINGLGLTPLVNGTLYQVSCIAYMSNAAEGFFWTQNFTDSSSPGHGAKYLTNRPRRVWSLMRATSTSNLDPGAAAAVALGSGTGGDPRWFEKGGDGLPATTEVYLGGFQIEAVDTGLKDGIAIIGDSTMQGSAGGNDSQASSQMSRWLESLLNVTCFNRGVSGNKTADMVTRYSTDITPLAVRSKYLIVQGGVNDFGTSVALATVQSNFDSLMTSGTGDGLLPVACTCTPSVGIVDVPADEANRKTFNAWVRATYPRVIDLARAVDPSDSGVFPAALTSDGTHPNAAGNRVMGLAAAQASFWSFTRPTPYQKVTAATYP